MAPRSTRPAATANKLDDVMTLDSGKQRTNDKGEEKPCLICISYFPDGKQMVEGSTNNSARRWDLQTGEEIVEARFTCEREVWAIAVSRDSRWVVTGGGDRDHINGPGELKAREVETGVMKTFEGHSAAVSCVDISVDTKLLASGSWDHTARIWDLNTGKLVAGPFESSGLVGAVRFSQDSKKLAVKGGVYGRLLEVWDIQEQKLDRRVGIAGGGTLHDSPVFWTTKDRSIIAALTVDGYDNPTNIYEFDPSTLETVGAPFEGHTGEIRGIALSLDCALLASSSDYDSTIKLWAFESRQLLASFDVHIDIHTLILSPNSRQLAYTTFDPSRIHICDIPPDILARIWPEQVTCRVYILTAYIYLLGTNSSCRLNVRAALTHSTYAILSFCPSISLIIHLYCSLIQLVILLPCAVTKCHGLQPSDR